MVEQRARTEHEARQRYIDFLSQPLNCVTNSQWVSFRPKEPSASWTLLVSTSAGGPVRLRTDGIPVFFRALQRFESVQIGPDEWRMHTVEYKYEVWEPQSDRSQRPVIEWHWHPSDGLGKGYHIHLRATEFLCGVASRRLHIPTERVPFESVVRFLIDEMRVIPRHDDWRRRVDESMGAFQRFRTDRSN